MRIAVNTLSAVAGRTGGGETYLRNLLSAMVPLLRPGERLILYCTRRNAGLLPTPAGAVRHVLLPALPRPLRVALEHLLLGAFVRRDGVDVLLAPGNVILPLAGVPQVLALQSLHYLLVGGEMSRVRVAYFRRLVPLSCGRAARVLCMSEDLRRTLVAAVPRAAGKAVVVHEGADLSVFGPADPQGDGGYLLYVGSLNPFKRPDTVVRALGRLRREGLRPPVLRMVGRPDPADRRRIEALAGAEGVADLVRIEGVVPYSDLPALYGRAAALVYPSAVETFGLPPLEAMACGCPVIAGNRTSVPEIVGDAAVLVDPDDPAALAGAIGRVLGSAGAREDLRRSGFANIRRFSWERAAGRTLSALRDAKCLGRARARR